MIDWVCTILYTHGLADRSVQMEMISDIWCILEKQFGESKSPLYEIEETTVHHQDSSHIQTLKEIDIFV